MTGRNLSKDLYLSPISHQQYSATNQAHLAKQLFVVVIFFFFKKTKNVFKHPVL